MSDKRKLKMISTMNAAVPSGAPDPEVRAIARRRQFSAAYKLAVLEEAARLTAPGAIGALLRREGLYSSHLTTWRREREAGARQGLSGRRGRKPKTSPEQKSLAVRGTVLAVIQTPDGERTYERVERDRLAKRWKRHHPG